MKTNIKKTLQTLTLSFGALLIVTTVTYAIGTLAPTGTAGDDTQYSLNDIYNKLTDFTNTYAEDTGSITVPGMVEETFATLSDIYGLLEDEEADLIPENIANGVEIFGVTGTKDDGIVYGTEWSTTASSSSMVWSAAVTYCDTLEESAHTDWRLPTYIELVNAYLTSNPGNTLGFTLLRHWSTTENPSDVNAIYALNMSNAALSSFNKSSSGFYTRCVR